MILDLQSMFSGAVAADGTKTAQAITATAISTNVIDLRAPSGAPAIVDNGILGGGGLWLTIQVIQAFNTLTSLTITLESSAAAGLTSSTVHYSQSVALAALTANTEITRVPMPSGNYLRYLGLRYTVVGSNPTTGSLLAQLSFDINRNVIYPSGFTVDV